MPLWALAAMLPVVSGNFVAPVSVSRGNRVDVDLPVGASRFDFIGIQWWDHGRFYTKMERLRSNPNPNQKLFFTLSIGMRSSGLDAVTSAEVSAFKTTCAARYCNHKLRWSWGETDFNTISGPGAYQRDENTIYLFSLPPDTITPPPSDLATTPPENFQVYEGAIGKAQEGPILQMTALLVDEELAHTLVKNSPAGGLVLVGLALVLVTKWRRRPSRFAALL